MYIRITTARFDAARAQVVQGLAESTVGPAVRKLPGCKSYVSGVDRTSNRLVAISTWETEEQARFQRDQLGSDLVKQLQDAGVVMDEALIYEAVVEA